MKHLNKFIYILFLVIVYSCTDPYALQTNTFEDVIVIEATITNELKKQEIKISRTFQLEEKEPQIETNATVYIIDDLGNQFNFEESNGKYISEFEFQAFPEREYQLYIITNKGKHYSSTREKLSTINNLTSIEASVKNKFGINGVDITANSFDPSGTSKYYRYEYEETYRFSVPYWSNDSLIVIGEYPFTFGINERNGESKTCYKSEKPKNIILENTTSFLEDRVSDFSIRFISQENYIIADRYSILVKQYVQNLESYNFYYTLQKISNSGGILSPNQPGFIYGNISAVENKNEKVIGFFDVSSVSEKRIFFNYTDLFPGEPLPAYFYECEILDYDETKLSSPGVTPSDGNKALGALARQKDLILYQNNSPIYRMVIPECGDCRTTGSNIIPDFWE